MPTSTAAPRREIRYSSLDELLTDADQLCITKIRTLGAWSYPQILDHLSRAIVASLDGFGFKAPWFARVLIAPFAKNSMLTKTMSPGFKLPKSATRIIPDADLSLAVAFD